MTRPDDPGQRLAQALRAQARGAGAYDYDPGPPPVAPTTRTARRAQETPPGMSTRTALLLALLAGALLGTVLALLSLWAPGALPPLG